MIHYVPNGRLSSLHITDNRMFFKEQKHEFNNKDMNKPNRTLAHPTDHTHYSLTGTQINDLTYTLIYRMPTRTDSTLLSRIQLKAVPTFNLSPTFFGAKINPLNSTVS